MNKIDQIYRKLSRGRLTTSLGTSGVDGMMMVTQFATGVVVARALSPVGRGELATVLLWPTFFFTFIASGLRFSLMYHLGAYPEKRDQVVYIAAAFGVCASLLVAILNYVLIGSILTQSDPLVIALTQLLGCFMPVLFFAGFLPSILQGERRYKLWNTIRLIDPLANLVLLSLLFFFDLLSVFSAAAVFLVVKACIMAFLFGSVRVRRPSGTFDWQLVKSIGVYLIKCLPTGWMGQANSQLDQMLMSAFFPPQVLGLYRIAVSSSNLLRILPMGIQRIVLPETANTRSSSEKLLGIKSYLSKGALFTGVGLLPAFVLIGPAICIAYGPDFIDSIMPARILLFGVFFAGLVGIFVNGMRGLGKPMISLWAEGFGAVITIAGLLVLLPVLGINGAAVTTVIAYSATFIMLLATYSRMRRKSDI